MESVQKGVPKRVCYEEQVVTQESKSYTPSILGAIVGAAVGNEFGKGRGKDLATVAGGVLGASVGRDVQNKNAPAHTAIVEKCHDEVEYVYEERVTGWRITYEYNGQTYVTRTDRDPGESIRLHIHIVPES
ncbi:MAG: glycine zipper 2TM domain-containing protein [Gammaproteobacteria bacterium]|nr:glycine zipper 2TM domain-containing protein [Gammaproteobacteria bacterium]